MLATGLTFRESNRSLDSQRSPFILTRVHLNNYITHDTSYSARYTLHREMFTTSSDMATYSETSPELSVGVMYSGPTTTNVRLPTRLDGAPTSRHVAHASSTSMGTSWALSGVIHTGQHHTSRMTCPSSGLAASLMTSLSPGWSRWRAVQPPHWDRPTHKLGWPGVSS